MTVVTTTHPDNDDVDNDGLTTMTEQQQQQRISDYDVVSSSSSSSESAAVAAAVAVVEDEKKDDEVVTVASSSSNKHARKNEERAAVEKEDKEDGVSTTGTCSGLSASSSSKDTPTTTIMEEETSNNNNNKGEEDAKKKLASWWVQTRALIWKNGISKFRSKVTTIFELLSPGLLLLFLVLGYNMSEIQKREANTYAKWDVSLPGPYLDILANVALTSPSSSSSSSSSRHLSSWNHNDKHHPPLQQLLEEEEDSLAALLLQLDKEFPIVPPHNHNNNNSSDQFLRHDSYYNNKNNNSTVFGMENDLWIHHHCNPWERLLETILHNNKNKDSFLMEQPQPPQRHRALQEDGNTNTTEQLDLEKQDFEAESGGTPTVGGGTSLGQIDRIRWELYQILRSPIPVPTLPLFVSLSQALSSQINANEIDQVYLRSDYVRRWGNLLTLGTIHLTPRHNPIVDEFLLYLQSTYNWNISSSSSSTDEMIVLSNDLKIRIHDNHDTALNFILNNLKERTWAMIDFEDTGKIDMQDDLLEMDDFQYTIRMNYTTLPNTNRIVNWSYIGLGSRYQRYYTSGYLTLQRTLNEFATSRVRLLEGTCDDVPDTSSDFGPWSLPFPTASYNQNPFFQAVGNLLGLTITMGFSFQVSRLVKSIVEEKESRMKETLAMLGVRPLAHWLAWVFTAYMSYAISTSVVVWILASSIMKFSDPVYLTAFVGLFSTSIVGFSFFIASFFSRAKLASIIGPIALFVTLLPRWIFFDTNRYEAIGGKLMASLLPCTAFAFGADILAEYEYAEMGVNRSNASEGNYSFTTSLSMMFFDSVLYLFLAWYLEEVLPRQYGVSRKFYFCLTPSYLADTMTQLFPCLFRRHATKTNHSKRNEKQDDDDDPQLLPEEEEDEEIQSDPNVEKADNSLSPQVFIQHLVKDYNTTKGDKGKKKPAVNDLNLTMYESQITCLLGHNGAGKTTTISVLTGLYKPTSGDCIIYGKRVTTNLSAARRSMGICPQHNILFPNLTVSEHLAFFERIKGLQPNKKSIQERAEEVGLGEFLHTQSHALSGGNKRKLHVAIAFCGDPEFLLLDEPTSGMDPYSRRATWELLRRKRTGRVTLLTTHFMDEAELLADRIAVLKEGSLQCCGSNIFLKNKFGLGYNITIVTEIQNETRESLPTSGSDLESNNGSSSNNRNQVEDERMEKISLFLHKHIPGTSLIRKSGREIVYRFPQGGEEMFPVLFEELEKNRIELGIGSYGASNTTLEEVFLQLAEKELADEDSPTPELEIVTGQCTESKDIDPIVKSLPETEGVLENKADIHESTMPVNNDQHNNAFSYSSGVSQIGLLLAKRFTVQKRDRKGTFCSIILPAILSGLVLLILMVDLKLAGPPIDVSVDLYKQSSSGGSSKATILVGGGLGARNLFSTDSIPDEAAVNEIQEDVSNLNQIYSKVHPHASFTHLKNIGSSQQMSDRMLETYREPGREAQFGSFIFRDLINVTVNVNWPALRADLEKVQNTPFVQSLPTVNLTDSLGSGETEFEINVTTSELKDFLNDLNVTENATISVNATIDFLSDLNETIFPNTTNNFFDGIIDAINNSTLGQDENSSQEINITVGEFIDVLNDNLNNTSDRIEGQLLISRGQVFFNPATSELTVSGLILQTDNGNITLAENATIDLETLLSLLVGDSTDDVFNFQFSNDISVMHNTTSSHAAASFNQAYYEYQFMKCSNTTRRLISVNHPLPLTSQQSIEIRTILSIFASLFLLIPYCYIPASFTVFLVKERVTKSKHLQLVSGVNMTSYWVASYLWDLFLYGILTVLIMCIFLMYGTETAQVFVGNLETFFCTALLTFGYGLSGLPFAYLFSRFFNNHSMAQISTMAFFFVTGFVAVNAYFIMDSLENTKHIAKGMRPLFWLWPPYNIGEGLINLSRNYFEREVLKQIKSPFGWKICGRSLALLYGLSVPYFLLLLILEYSSDGGSGGLVGKAFRFFRSFIYRTHLRLQGVKSTDNGHVFVHCSRTNGSIDENDFHSNEDSDVVKERKFVIENQDELRSTASVLITNLWKIYPRGNILISMIRSLFNRGLCRFCKKKKMEQSDVDMQKLPKMAVKGLTTAIMSGETFGLLGVNGAGKTTTLGVLTGDIRPTGGEAYVSSYDVTGSESQGVSMARKNTGFCPQVDPLIDLMTGRETLRMFGRLRGIPKKSIDETVSSLLELLTLTPHADKVSASYSGGNKRKLSLGIALIGNPSVMFIDEASSGMDPLARRKMWDLIAEAAKKRSVILTTHSMEEAEALCSRVAIMIGGKIRALGSVQHLKNKFLGGYSIELHCKYHSTNSQIDFVKGEILNHFEGCVLAEQHGRFLKFDLPSLASSTTGSSNLGNVFRLLQSMKTADNSTIDDYSVSQCTLEQVFISLVQNETDENKEKFLSN